MTAEQSQRLEYLQQVTDTCYVRSTLEEIARSIDSFEDLPGQGVPPEDLAFICEMMLVLLEGEPWNGWRREFRAIVVKYLDPEHLAAVKLAWDRWDTSLIPVKYTDSDAVTNLASEFVFFCHDLQHAEFRSRMGLGWGEQQPEHIPERLTRELVTMSLKYHEASFLAWNQHGE